MSSFPQSAISYCIKWKDAIIQENFLSNLSRERPSRELWLKEGNDRIYSFKKCNDDEFAGKQQCIINISAQLGFLILTPLQRRVYIAGGSMLKDLKKPISDST